MHTLANRCKMTGSWLLVLKDMVIEPAQGQVQCVPASCHIIHDCKVPIPESDAILVCPATGVHNLCPHLKSDPFIPQSSLSCVTAALLSMESSASLYERVLTNFSLSYRYEKESK